MKHTQTMYNTMRHNKLKTGGSWPRSHAMCWLQWLAFHHKWSPPKSESTGCIWVCPLLRWSWVVLSDVAPFGFLVFDSWPLVCWWLVSSFKLLVVYLVDLNFKIEDVHTLVIGLGVGWHLWFWQRFANAFLIRAGGSWRLTLNHRCCQTSYPPSA